MRTQAALVMAFVFLVAATTGGRAQEAEVEVAEAEESTAPPIASAEPTPPFDGFRRNDALWTARLCVHEATWSGREGGTSDCGGIIQVILNRMTDGETYEEQLSETTPRFWAGTTTRSWSRHLEAAPIRANPPGWPAAWPVASNYTEEWHSVYRHTIAYMAGREPLPCNGRVERWFGRRADAARLAEILAGGHWVEVECVGDGDFQERNAFLERAPEPEQEALGG